MASSKDTVAVVTGGNKGIGLEIVRGLAAHGITVVLTARDEARGLEAVELLKQNDLHVLFHKLDVLDSDSVNSLASWLKHQFNGIDILVNNAAIISPMGQSSNVENAMRVINTNYYGSKRMMDTLLPIMNFGSRIVNVSSSAGKLNLLRNGWKKRISDVENLTDETIDACLEAYLNDVHKGEDIERGWPYFSFQTDYAISKMALNAYSRLLARDILSAGKSISVNCMCPGHTSTSLSFFTGHPASIGAETAIWLALLPSNECSCANFFVKRQEVGFENIPLSAFDKMFFSDKEVVDYSSSIGLI